MVTLTLTVDRDDVAVDADLTRDQTGNLVAGGHVVVVGHAVGPPGQVELQGGGHTSTVGIDVDCVLECPGRRPAPDRHRPKWISVDVLDRELVRADGDHPPVADPGLRAANGK